jgi:two-component system, LytTR family, sensor kinase
MNGIKTSLWQSRWVRYCLVFAIWTFVGLCEGCHSYVNYTAEGKSVTWPRTLAMGLCLWYGWMILAIPVFHFARRFPLELKSWPWHLPLHVLAGAVFALIKLAMDYPVIYLFYCPTPWLLTFTRFYKMAVTDHFYPYLLIYWSLVGISHALNYYHKYGERTLKASQLEARLAHARLELLKKELHPHFLLNTLNAISALIHQDTEVADRMLARLGDLLRVTLENAGTQTVLLGQELDFLRSYLEIEQVRFGPRLSVHLDIQADALTARLPSLLLQPLVENAIKHGITAEGRGGQVGIRAECGDDKLRLQVWDNGPGLPGNGHRRTRTGIGLANTRARLQQLYGEQHRFELKNRNGGGTLATIELPLLQDADTPLPETLVLGEAGA